MTGEFNRVIGVAPSIIDAHHFYDTTLEWQTGLDTFDLRPGEWAEITDLSGEQCHALEMLPEPSLEAGSSILAVMTVLPEDIKKNSLLYATYAYNKNGLGSPDSAFFHATAEQWGVKTQAIPLTGENPTVHAFIDPSSGEKSFLKISGVSKGIDKLPDWEQQLTRNTIVSLDAYELIDGSTSETLRDVIEKAKSSIALSLGNVAILEGDLVQFIRCSGGQGALHSLFGNEEEFAVLLGDVPRTDAQLLKAHDMLNTRLVMTHGAKGISIAANGNYYHAEAPPLDAREIISTSGAGDAAMGVILGGFIEGEPIDTSLHKAILHCTRVVQAADDIVPRHI